MFHDFHTLACNAVIFMCEGDGILSLSCIVSDRGLVPWAEESNDMAYSAPVKSNQLTNRAYSGFDVLQFSMVLILSMIVLGYIPYIDCAHNKTRQTLNLQVPGKCYCALRVTWPSKYISGEMLLQDRADHKL